MKKSNHKIAFTYITILLFIILIITMLVNIYFFKPKENQEGKKIVCTPESREEDICIKIYKPVCAWFDPEKIQCIKYPCATTYSNSCLACQNEDVLYYTEGECPQ